MENDQESGVTVKLYVDKENNRVIFAESDCDFVDVLFSFLTIPMANLVTLTSNSSLVTTIGCFNNLRNSVAAMDIQHFRFRTDASKSMLLTPRSSAESECSELKLKIVDTDTEKFFFCSPKVSSITLKHLCSHYPDIPCQCGKIASIERRVGKSESDASGGVFVKGANRFIVTDDLRVMLVSTHAMVSLFSLFGITNKSSVEETTLVLGTAQVKRLLISSLVSKTVFTDTILKREQDLQPRSTVSSCKLNYLECGTNKDQSISVKLILSKSKGIVCYAEANRDFVNLLFRFLTIQIGHVAKQIHRERSLDGCINHLYESVSGLHECFFKSSNSKKMLASSGTAFGISYRNDLLGIDQPVSSACHNYDNHYCRYNQSDGYLSSPATFVVTDCLEVTPISLSVCFSILENLNVGSDDIVEHVVHVGKNEALRLLVSSFISENALTNTFLIKNPKQEPMG